MAVISLLLSCITVSVCDGQALPMLCSREGGNFETTFRTGVRVHVGPVRNGELATRRCEADLSWGKEKLVVAADAAQIDVDVIGTDLGLGLPVVSFQIKQSNDECCLSYQIYSLKKPPALLRTLRGGTRFSAADTDLDGHIEVWTDDAASVEGFDGLPSEFFDLPPTVVLRFEKGRLIDVGSEFKLAFDDEIAKLRSELEQNDLLDFKRSDGGQRSLGAGASPGDVKRWNRERSVKVKILEIVWSYLYSGREQEAWNSLAGMWPDADLMRVRAEIFDARARGMRLQIDGVSTLVPRGARTEAMIFEDRPQTVVRQGRIGQGTSITGPPDAMFTFPKAITLPSLVGKTPKEFLQSEVPVELVIDSAGKVRSVRPATVGAVIDPAIQTATKYWKFIPGFHENEAIACRVKMAISLER